MKNLGTILARQGNIQEAIGHYRRALEIEPVFTEARYNLARALLRQAKFQAAATEYRTVIDERPDAAQLTTRNKDVADP